MNTASRSTDFEHPLIQRKAIELTGGEATALAKIECIFGYVRDGIKFGFPPRKWFRIRAAETMAFGVGQCVSKSVLFVALCRAAGIPAMLHSGSIDNHILEGLLPSLSYRALPKYGNHVWADVQIEGEYRSIDTFILDKPLYDSALRRLKDSGKSMGYGIALSDGKSSCEFGFGEKGFVQMGAVLDDHGRWEDYSEYVASSFMKLSPFRERVMDILAPLMSLRINRHIERIRVSPGPQVAA